MRDKDTTLGYELPDRGFFKAGQLVESEAFGVGIVEESESSATGKTKVLFYEGDLCEWKVMRSDRLTLFEE